MERYPSRKRTDREREEVRYQLYRHLGKIGTSGSGWVREVNVVSWNNGQPGVDIRFWNEAHDKMSRGINLPLEEAVKLQDLLKTLSIEEMLPTAARQQVSPAPH